MDIRRRRIPDWATAAHMRAGLVTEALQRARLPRSGQLLEGAIAPSGHRSRHTSTAWQKSPAPRE